MLSYISGELGAYFRRDQIFAKVIFDENFTFAEHTTYGLGGRARGAFYPRNLPEARAVYDRLTEEGENFVVLAQGSNILAADGGYDGYVICTKKLQGIARINSNTIFCLSGTPVGRILQYCRLNGLGGLEYLAGIPASIGGIACMNGGAGGVYINSNVLSVKLYNGKDYNLSNKNCNYGYKHSTMRDINSLIFGVFLSVLTDLPSNVASRIEQNLRRRSSLPAGRSCGCVFKNPVDKTTGGRVSAGAIIEECGLKGFGSERAFVSPQHCNFIINRGATAREVRNLIEKVKVLVERQCAITLEEEVVYIGNFD